ncbi:hypothetical protein F2P81_019728 [Scophthalmus maximus]|uniref:ACB domain-containing protein n=1 Tax=Scophthalmus maximus TaxID=52904 RepID=A0A6A4SC27_SCOMX|nr:hypothetical protein F2P81_019728 [Scophthalmus maximus]
MKGATVQQFETAKNKLSTLQNDPGNRVKLQIYALFKQATQGPCTTSSPGMLDFVNRAKWDAWKALGSISQVQVLTQAQMSAGAGDFYCSGNDLNNFVLGDGGVEEKARQGAELLRKYVRAYIGFPKPLVAVVNGPAVGISVTLLGLFDLVYASERATFHTPFSQLGQSPEGCSSYTFPSLMGPAKASEMLLFNKKVTAAQACELRLVTEVFPESSFQTEVWTRLKAYAKLPPNSLALSRQLIRSVEKQRLYDVNDLEVECLRGRWVSDECAAAIMSFFQAKAKL